MKRYKTCHAIYWQKARIKRKDIDGSERMTGVCVCQWVNQIVCLKKAISKQAFFCFTVAFICNIWMQINYNIISFIDWYIKFPLLLLTNLPWQHCCVTLSICLLLTVTCNSTAHRMHCCLSAAKWLNMHTTVLTLYKCTSAFLFIRFICCAYTSAGNMEVTEVHTK